MPAAPVVSIIEPYRNTFTFRLKGTCAPFPVNCWKLHYDCSDGLGGTLAGVGDENTTKGCVNNVGSPSTHGTFDFVETFPGVAGRTWSCRMWCQDVGGNISLDSNSVSSQICNPQDVYDLANVGNSAAAAADRTPGDAAQWAIMVDETAPSRDVYGNIIGQTSISEVGQTDDTYDWFVVRTQDNNANDLVDQRNSYNFQIQMLQGVSDYDIQVYRYLSGAVPGTQQCSGTGTYDDYNYFARDNYEYDSANAPYNAIWHPHHHPYSSYNADGLPNGTQQPISDRQRCKSHPSPVSPPNAIYNDCFDYTSNYYFRVNRVTPNTNWNCTNYQLRVSLQ